MSWGERSCIHAWSDKPRPCSPEVHTCNVNCPHYAWNGVTAPDSVKITLTDKPLVEALTKEPEAIPGSSPRSAGIVLPTVGEMKRRLMGLRRKQ